MSGGRCSIPGWGKELKNNSCQRFAIKRYSPI